VHAGQSGKAGSEEIPATFSIRKKIGSCLDDWAKKRKKMGLDTKLQVRCVEGQGGNLKEKTHL